MNDFLSKISGQIAGSIILSAFLPAVLFLTAVVLVVLPITPYLESLIALGTLLQVWEDKASTALVITALVLVLAILLYMLNVPIIRLYEGYPWRQSWIGSKLQNGERKRFDDASQLRAKIRDLRMEIRLGKIPVETDELSTAERALARLLNDSYPSASGLVLPTRLGNVIRSFEMYPLHQYGLPAIAVWPRLQGVLPPTYAQALEGSQTSFSFMLNCSFLSAVLAALLTLCGLRWAHPFQPGSQHAWILWVIVFGAMWRLFYHGATNRAAEWGVHVRAAFDLYRSTLLTQLGYDLKPETPEEERRIWSAINYKLAFPDDHSYPELPYKRQSTSLLVEPSSVVVTFRRIVSVTAPDKICVGIALENTDPLKFDAEDVILRDEIPPGKTYIPYSCTVDGVRCTPLDLDPFRIQVGTLAAGKARAVAYELSVETMQ